MIKEACTKKLPKTTCVWTARHVPPKPWSLGNVLELLIGWFVCAALTTEMCLGIWVDGCVCGAQPVRARVGAGKASTASRLPAWHQNRWMPLIITVCNVLNSITPPSCSIQHLSRSLAEAVCRMSERSCIHRHQVNPWSYLSHQENLHTFSSVQQLRYKLADYHVLVCIQGEMRRNNVASITVETRP